jgi:hypothetical protein
MDRRGELLGHSDLLPLNMSFLGPIGQMDCVLVSSDIGISSLPRSCHPSDPLQVKFMFSLRATRYSAIFLMRSNRSMSQSLMKFVCCR